MKENPKTATDADRNSSEQNSNEEDFSMVFQRYYAAVLHTVERIVRERSAAEDLTQDVFWRLYHVSWQDIKNLKAFLIQSGINAAYNHLRSTQRQLKRWERLRGQASGDEPSAETHWFRREEIQKVREVLKELNERDRSLLLLRFEGLSYREIGEVIAMDPASVGTSLIRAKGRFRASYLKREED